MRWWFFPVVGALFTLAGTRLAVGSKTGSADRVGWTVVFLALGLACFVAGNLWMLWD